jgi:hypothetical protein
MDFVVCAQLWPSASFRHVADRSCLYSVGGTGSGIGYAFELGYGYLRRPWATFLRRQEGIGYVSRKVIVMSVIFFFYFWVLDLVAEHRSFLTMAALIYVRRTIDR